MIISWQQTTEGARKIVELESDLRNRVMKQHKQEIRLQEVIKDNGRLLRERNAAEEERGKDRRRAQSRTDDFQQVKRRASAASARQREELQLAQRQACTFRNEKHKAETAASETVATTSRLSSELDTVRRQLAEARKRHATETAAARDKEPAVMREVTRTAAICPKCLQTGQVASVDAKLGTDSDLLKGPKTNLRLTFDRGDHRRATGKPRRLTNTAAAALTPDDETQHAACEVTTNATADATCSDSQKPNALNANDTGGQKPVASIDTNGYSPGVARSMATRVEQALDSALNGVRAAQIRRHQQHTASAELAQARQLRSVAAACVIALKDATAMSVQQQRSVKRAVRAKTKRSERDTTFLGRHLPHQHSAGPDKGAKRQRSKRLGKQHSNEKRKIKVRRKAAAQ